MCSCTQRKSRSDTHAHNTHTVWLLSVPWPQLSQLTASPDPLYPAQFGLHAANRTNREQVCDTGWAALFWARPLAPCPLGSDSHWVSGSGEGGIHPLSSLGAGWGGKGQPRILTSGPGLPPGSLQTSGKNSPSGQGGDLEHCGGTGARRSWAWLESWLSPRASLIFVRCQMRIKWRQVELNFPPCTNFSHGWCWS